MLHEGVSVALHLLEALPAALKGRYLPLGRLAIILEPSELGLQLLSTHVPLAARSR